MSLLSRLQASAVKLKKVATQDMTYDLLEDDEEYTDEELNWIFGDQQDVNYVSDDDLNDLFEDDEEYTDEELDSIFWDEPETTYVNINQVNDLFGNDEDGDDFTDEDLDKLFGDNVENTTEGLPSETDPSERSLEEEFRPDPESGITVGYDGTLESLLEHLRQSHDSQGQHLQIGDEEYYGFITENDIDLVKARNGEVVGVVSLAFDGPTFQWGETIQYEEDPEQQTGLWITSNGERELLLSYE